MSAPVLTAEQRWTLFEEAASWTQDGFNPTKEEATNERFRDAIHTLNLLGWDPGEQDQPLVDLSGDPEALAGLRRLAGKLADERAEMAREDVERAREAVKHAWESWELVEDNRAIIAALGRPR